MKRILLALALGFLLCGCIEIPPAADPAPPQPEGEIIESGHVVYDFNMTFFA